MEREVTDLPHQSCPKAEAKAKAVEMLRLVGIPDPEKNVDCYPHPTV